MSAIERLRANIVSVYMGNTLAVDRILTCLLARGHALIEDVPGVGKTVLANALARSIDCSFSRIQCTPDLLPADITGVSIYRKGGDEFEFRPGPIFANIVLCDEINRTTPRTQSAMLEAMSESTVTAEGEIRSLPSPFMVIATQNPIEHEGTYALPEAQLDRFLMRLEIGYPDREAELEILHARGGSSEPADHVPAVLSATQIAEMSASLEQIYLAPALKSYLLDLADATRRHPALALGLSPRGVVALQRVVRAQAASEGRTYATPDDVKQLVRHVISHRLLVTPESRMRGTRPVDVVGEILDALPVPRPSNG